jgi:diguanylate cyclase (GGDEF)-like protein
VPLGGRMPGHLLIARSGEDSFTIDEISLVRGMARVLELTIGTLETLEAERRQATENQRLLASLQERHRLLEQLSRIQRAITRREPLQHILDTITAGARELLGDEVAGLRLRDPDDPQMLLLVSQTGMRTELAKELWRVGIRSAGATGLAVLRDELVVMEHYATAPESVPELAAEHIQAAMAAPVHENGAVVGGLVVASYQPRVFSENDQSVLQVFAEHVSLAVTDHRIREQMYEAYHDSLTGLASRALFLEQLEHGLARAARQHSQLAVLFVDLDRFKLVNDSLGHAAGDILLIGVADRLRSCLRVTDTAARFGGDEFAIVLHDLGHREQAVLVARRIIEVLQQPFVVHGKEVFVNASIGITFNTEGGVDAEDLMRTADLAMYEAKKNGKGHYETYRPAMRAHLMRSLDLEADLRRALDRDEFVLHYQPIVELTDGMVNGVEALVRWRRPDRDRLIEPLTFIPCAEETGLIVPIGLWVLHEACRQASRWNAQRRGRPPLTMSVNLSARQLQQPDLPGVVAQILLETALEPSSLVLELTESLLLHDTEAALTQLRQLKALGVRLAIDDFGTGYSSLAYLRKFPIDIIKIDKSFVDELAAGGDGATLTRAIVQLGQTMQLVTVAEGIETGAQLVGLRDAGCSLGQGYYFAKSLERDEVETILLNGSRTKADLLLL